MSIFIDEKVTAMKTTSGERASEKSGKGDKTTRAEQEEDDEEEEDGDEGEEEEAASKRQ